MYPECNVFPVTSDAFGETKTRKSGISSIISDDVCARWREQSVFFSLSLSLSLSSRKKKKKKRGWWMSFLWCSWEIFVVDSFFIFWKKWTNARICVAFDRVWNDASRQAAAKRRSLSVAEISKQDKKVIYSSVFFEKERCFPFTRERSINTHVVRKKSGFASRRRGAKLVLF